MSTDFIYEDPDPEVMRNVVEMLHKRLSTKGVAICLSGIDGSGKTTLARSLVEALKGEGVPTRRLHYYQWYVNIIITPIVILYNRLFGRKVLVLDRGIYDNLAVMTLKFRCPRLLSDVLARLMRVVYPKVDYSFYLVASFNDTLERRSDTRQSRFTLLTENYDRLMRHVRHCVVRSDEQLFNAALQHILRGSKWSHNGP